MRCDIPCGFGELGKIMADMKPYKEINDGKELVDFIIKEESGK
nr:MAG TPA: Superoxide dismutase [Caudoviricetes sp.]